MVTYSVHIFRILKAKRATCKHAATLDYPPKNVRVSENFFNHQELKRKSLSSSTNRLARLDDGEAGFYYWKLIFRH